MNAYDRGLFTSSPRDRQNVLCELGNRTKSNLPLQIALYLNVWVYPFWLLTLIVNLDAKYYKLLEIYKVLTITVFLVLSLLEPIRLYLGYRGNLAGKIPELASFWLISTLIQLPLEMFLLFDNGPLPAPSEYALNTIVLSLLVCEIIAGTVALRTLSDYRAKLFYLTEMYELEDKHNR